MRLLHQQHEQSSVASVVFLHSSNTMRSFISSSCPACLVFFSDFFFSFVLFFFRIFFCLLSCALPETVSLRFAIVSRVQYGGGGEGEGVVMGHEGLGGGRGKYVSGDSK